MKATTLFLITGGLCLCCGNEKEVTKATSAQNADEAKSPLDPPEFWKPLESKLADYVAAQPGRPIILSVSAKWSATSTLAWRVLFSGEVTRVLKTSGFLCLVGDITEGDLLATGVINALDRVAVPVTAIYDPVDQAWHVQPEVFSSADVGKWISSLQNKIVEQAGRGGGDKPSN